ncbi:MAG TPA: multicopper oxidase domain-containing protein [Bryobacteraceae bacterium]|nr:multicopper oxidase domain-containing protein [Bryobacteraceae bacterium]
MFICAGALMARPELAAQDCPRPAIGSAVEEPADVRSSGGMLHVSFAFRSSTGRFGAELYCYLSADGAQSPTLRVHAGDELALTLKNELPSGGSAHMHGNHSQPVCGGGPMTAASTNLHFHGLEIPPACHQDETLHTLIQPGDPGFEYRVKIPADQPPGLYWYHPHPHGFSERQVLGGASGALIVGGIERSDPRVAGLAERVLILRDEAVPGLAEDAEDSGPGKNISINYVPVMYPLYRPAGLSVRPAQREFWRVLNAAADTYFDVQVRFGPIIQDIQDPQLLDLVALDGVPIGGPAADRRTHVLLAPGARAEFILSTPPLGTFAQLVTLSYDTGPDGAASPYRVIANIDASNSAPPIPAMPAAPAVATRSFTGLTAAKPVRTRRLYFSETVDPQDPKATKYFITAEGATPKVFDMNFVQPDIQVRQGTVEDWVIENRAKEAHAFHIHQLHFQLLERDGEKVNEPALRDTIDLPYWDGKSQRYPSVKLRMDFRNPAIVGTFVYHCHILEHEDGGMMGVIQVNRR